MFTAYSFLMVTLWSGALPVFTSEKIQAWSFKSFLQKVVGIEQGLKEQQSSDFKRQVTP